MFISAIILSVFSIIISYLLFRPSIFISNAFKAIDYPSERKIHFVPTARGGGICLFLPFSLLLLIAPIRAEIKFSFILGGTVLFFVGFGDDARSLPPFKKLAGIALASALYIFARGTDSAAESVAVFSWLIFSANATNLSDGLNGLAGGMSASQALCLAALAIAFQNAEMLMVSLLLLGAIIGFLPRNFPHAKIFMGDCGALFLGFTLGAISAELIAAQPNALSVVSVYLIFRMTVADALSSFFRRLSKGRNPFNADKEHFHHKLLKWGFEKDCAALALITSSLLLGLIGVVISFA